MKIFNFIIFAFFFNLSLAQEKSINYSNINIELGTILIYNSAAINYESINFLKQKSIKHCLKFSTGIGIWNATTVGFVKGFFFNTNAIYLYGENQNHFEINLGASYHFSKGLDETKITYITTTPNLFIGYRYQKPEGKLNFKIGTRIFELLQVGFGYSFR